MARLLLPYLTKCGIRVSVTQYGRNYSKAYAYTINNKYKA